jgi:hypothetical protein
MMQNINLQLEGFSELNLNELEDIDGGGFWDGLAMVGTSIALGAGAIALVAAAPVVGTAAGVGVVIAIGASQFGLGTGLAMMCGADL